MTKAGHTYTPNDTVSYENWVKLCYRNQGGPFLEGEIEVILNVYYSIPKSASKKKSQLMAMNKINPTKKPDCDNVAKIVLDSLNGIAYKDDSQVVSLTVNKLYGLEPGVELLLKNKSDDMEQ